MSEFVEKIKRILTNTQTIAVVGLSHKPERASNIVARYLLDHGCTVIPVNPGKSEILGQTAYPDLASIPGQIDLVDVFRRSEYTPPIAEQAVAIGAKYFWLQLGIENAEAEQIAEAGGLEVVMNRCIKVEHARYFHA